MSVLDGISLFCEDEDGGPTARLLLIAIETFKQRGERVARLLAARPTGSKEDVKVRVRHARRDHARAVSLRDRDFLERRLVDDFRRKALPSHPEPRTAEAWPLARHAIESYLLDPPFLAEAMPQRSEGEWRALIDELAEARKWTDLVRATLVDLRYRIGQAERSSTTALFTNREAALAELEARFRETRAAVDDALNEDALSAKFSSLERDFAEDGPLFARVDGKELLKDLDTRLVRDAVRRTPGLKGSLLSHAERRQGPEALISDLGPLVTALASVPSSAW